MLNLINIPNVIILEVCKFMDIDSLINIHKIKLTNTFDEKENNIFYNLVWNLARKNIRNYEKQFTPWKYNIQLGRFSVYFPIYNEIMSVHLDKTKWVKRYLLNTTK